MKNIIKIEIEEFELNRLLRSAIKGDIGKVEDGRLTYLGTTLPVNRIIKALKELMQFGRSGKTIIENFHENEMIDKREAK